MTYKRDHEMAGSPADRPDAGGPFEAVGRRVFAYGSLVARPGERATLPGYRRTWGAAMDNAVALPGYKRYRDPATGEHPDVRVAFLALAPDPATEVEGVLLEVDDDGLAALDRREVNYDRTAVTMAGGERAWTYVPSAGGVARAAAAPVVVARAYRDAVRTAYAALGDDALHAFDATTDAPPTLADLVLESVDPGSEHRPSVRRDQPDGV